jgi:hypothetical protein
MRDDHEEFGEARLLQVAHASAGLSPLELKSRLLSAVNQFCNSNLHDDATLLLIAAQTPDHDAHAGAESGREASTSCHPVSS